MHLLGRYRIDLAEGETYIFEPDEIDVADEITLESQAEQAGMDQFQFDEWVDAVNTRRAVPAQLLVWFLRLKAGNPTDFRATNFQIRKLDMTRICAEPGCPVEMRVVKDAMNRPVLSFTCAEHARDNHPSLSADSAESEPPESATSQSSPDSESDPGNGTDSPDATS